MLAAEAAHRDHAIIEQVIADLKDSALAHLPSGGFAANAAWLICAAVTHNLTRADGALAGAIHAAPAPAPCAPGSSTPRAGSPAVLLHLPQRWPGKPGSTNCSATPCTIPSPQPPDHPPTRLNRRPQWKTGQTGSTFMSATRKRQFGAPGRIRTCYTRFRRAATAVHDVATRYYRSKTVAPRH